MNLFNKVWRLFGGGGLNNPEHGQQHTSRDSVVDEAINVSNDRALSISTVWACVRLITSTVGCLPMHIYKKTDTGRELTERTHSLNMLLRGKPNLYMSAVDFRCAMTFQLATWGNAYAAIQRNDAGEPIQLIPLNPERMHVHRLTDGLSYVYDHSAGQTAYASDSIFHIKGTMTIDGIVGLSPLSYAGHSLGITAAADNYASRQFTTGGQPKGVLTVDAILTKEQRAQLKKIYAGVTSTEVGTNLFVLEGGTKYAPTTLPPDVMQMLESRSFQVAEVCRYFGIPSFLVNDSEKSTSFGTGLQTINLSFLTYCIQSYLTSWESAITDQLIPREDQDIVYAEFNESAFLRSDMETQAKYLVDLTNNGLQTKAEAREKLNLKYLGPETDRLIVPINHTFLDNLGKSDAVSQTE